MSILFILVPLLIFVLVDTFASLNMALIVTFFVAVAECGYAYFVTGEIDSFSIFSFFLLALLAALSYFKQSRKLFYLKPAILSYSMGVFLLGTYVFDQNFFFALIKRMDTFTTPESKALFESPLGKGMMTVAPLTVGVASIFHGMAATFAALKMNRWGWFVVAGLGSFLFLTLGFMAAAFITIIQQQNIHAF